MKVVVLVLASLLVVALADRVKIMGSRAPTNPPPGWTLQESAPASHPVKMLIGLKQRNIEQLEELFWAVSTPGNPEYRKFKSQDEILALIAPPRTAVKRVMKWLAHNGVDISKVKDNGDSLELQTTVGVAEKLANTRFNMWQNAKTGKRLARIVGTWGIDSEIAPMIDMIEGLTEFPIPHYGVKRGVQPEAPMTLVSICPESVNVIYKVPSGTKNTGNSSICVAEWEDQYFDPSQLQKFAKDFALTIPAVSKDHIVGTNDPSNPGIESTLDIQYVTGVSPGTTAWFWIEGDSAWLWTYASHVFGTTPAPLIFSISYGWSEAEQCQYGIGGQECQKLGVNSKQYVQRVNIEFQKIGLRGISLFAASGDSGANGRTDPDCTDKILHPDYPGCSPYVTAVGATQITQSSGVSKLPNPPPGCKGNACASGGDETAVSYDQAQFASGGGFSWVAAQPSYQTKAVAAYMASGVKLPPAAVYNASGRGYPDVAAFGSNVLIESGGIQPVGGTSCSSPIFAGLMGLLNGYVNQKTGKPLGFMNPLLYQMAAAQPSTFNDITVGNNKCTESGCSPSCKGFYAAKGWDPVTGLGTPVFSAIQSYVEQALNIPK
jgi:subtilase family serine protease